MRPVHAGKNPKSVVELGLGSRQGCGGDADREMILQYARNYLDYTTIYLARNRKISQSAGKSGAFPEAKQKRLPIRQAFLFAIP